jgi:hypothetical protein
MQTSPTGIQLQTKYFILNFLIAIFPLTVTVDGTPVQAKWGSSFVPVAPGSHQVSVSWKLYWVLPVNKAALTVNVPEGQVVPVLYKAPYFWFMPGKLSPSAA